MIIELTGARDDTGPARLPDMVAGRLAQAVNQWLTNRPRAWRDAAEVVAMDGFTAELPDAVAVMDSFHVVRLTPTSRPRRPRASTSG